MLYIVLMRFDSGRIALSVLLPLLCFGQTAAAEALNNIASGKPYTMSVAPNYALSTEPGDSTQLTDGQLTPHKEGSGFWAHQATVGWNHVRTPISITIDLGEEKAIGGVALHSGAGVSAVAYPRSIAVLVSNDGEDFTFIGDLVRLTETHLPPAYGQYSRYAYRTTSLSSRGRFVRFVVASAGIYFFADEIEVYASDAVPAGAMPDKSMSVGSLVAPSRLTQLGAYARIRSDAESVLRMIDDADLPSLSKDTLRSEIHAVLDKLNDQEEVVTHESFRAIVPYNALHRQVFQGYAKLLRNDHRDGIYVWKSAPYEMLGLFEAPRDTTGPIKIAALQNEPRAGAVNITNTSSKNQAIRLRFAQGGQDISVAQVEYVDTREGAVVHSALLPLESDAEGYYSSEVAAGLTRQLWLTFKPDSRKPGVHRETLIIESAGRTQRVNIELRVAHARFPSELTIAFNGWDYTMSGLFDVTETNREPLRKLLLESMVNGSWVNRNRMPRVSGASFDKDGNLVGAIDFSAWNDFVHAFPGMRHYLVYAYRQIGESFGGISPDSAAYDRAWTQYAAAWQAHNRVLGLEPGQVLICFHDEPRGDAYFKSTRRHADAFDAGSEDILTYTDPHISSVTDELGLASNAAHDIVAPHLPAFVAMDADVRNAYAAYANSQQDLWFYSCSGPTRHFDPSYFRYQPWYNLEYGGKGSQFWAFSDAGGASSWNEYVAIGRTAYTSFYLGSDSAHRSKHFAAAEEGVQDFEYFQLLAKQAAALKADSRKAALVERIEKFLATAPSQTTRSLNEHHDSPELRSKSSFASSSRLRALELLDQSHSR